MNRFQKEITSLSLEQEKKVFKEIKKQYEQAMREVEAKIAALMARKDEENLQSIIYQLNYQNAIKGQIGAILDNLKSNNFTSIQDYLRTCYEDGFIGTMYDLQGQGIPLIFPIDQEQMIRAIVHDTKLSDNLYKTLGHDVNDLKRNISSTISRGIAANDSYANIARSIRINGDVYRNKAYRIARTEGHRITQEATYDAQMKAKETGADVVKQWDSTLDSRTRPEHRQLDGQIREVDEAFEISGSKAMYPGNFGRASLDINCRCVIIQRAKWALDEEELQALKERAKYFGLNKNEDFDEFKKKYLKVERWLDDQDKYSEKYGITQDERASIMRYVQSYSYIINDALRKNTKLTGLYKEDVENIRSALNKLPNYKGDLTRSVEFYNREDLEEFINQHKVGKTIKYNQFISTTTGETYNPDGQVQIFILDSKNGKDITPFNYEEKEVLYDLDEEFEVVEIKEKNGKYQIKLRER